MMKARHTHVRRLAGAIAIASSFAAIPSAHAQTSAADSAAAQSLYDDGRKLFTNKDYASACPKFQESQRLDPTPVTEFWLADCYEHAGKTASAWAAFLDLAATEHKTGGPKSAEREKVARDRAKALEPKLTQLTISVAATTRVDGLVIKRDGEPVLDGQWGAPVAVDPGNHTIDASAPGKAAWTKTLDVEGAGQTVNVDVPALADAPASAPAGAAAPGAAPPPAPAPEQPAETKSSPLRTVGLVVAGVGAAGLVVGGIFGGMALSSNSSANNGNCGTAFGGTNECNATGVSDRSSAVRDGNISTIAFIAGGVLAAGGITLFFLAPKSSVEAAPAVGMGTAGVTLRGSF
jgi:hypothetical protein